MFSNSNVIHRGKIIGIDPGTETLGLCVMDIDFTTGTILGTRANTFVGSKLPLYDRLTETALGGRNARLQAHEENLYQLFHQEVPLIVSCESPFYNYLRPQAYGALLSTVDTVQRALQRYDVFSQLYLIDPPNVKIALGAKGNAKKEAVFEALQRVAPILNMQVPVETLDEHSVDAIAVTYGTYKRLILPTI